jgi:hypothetical protein
MTRPGRSSSSTGGSTPRRAYGGGRRPPSSCATSWSRWSQSGPPELRDHIDNVALVAQGVGQRLGLRAHELHEVVRAAELHDIGTMAIPDAILAKPGPLDAAEWEFIRQHTIVGERMLHMAPALAGVARLVRWSHERVDGGGYPDGLVGHEIPLGARIVAVCDAFAAMTSDRPYRRPVSPDEAVAELIRHSGTQFDAEVIAAFQAELADPPRDRAAIPLAARFDGRALSVRRTDLLRTVHGDRDILDDRAALWGCCGFDECGDEFRRI